VKLHPELDEAFCGLPGEEIIREGLDDLSAARESIGSLLVQIGEPKLRMAGVPLPANIDLDADRKLYSLLAQSHGVEAHSQYNAWIRQLVSFERALEQRLHRRELRRKSDSE
jgi:hypothetical protein